jgi:hypothetical protein
VPSEKSPFLRDKLGVLWYNLMMIIGVIEFLVEMGQNFAFADAIPLPCDPHGVDKALIKNIFSRSIPCADDGTAINSTLDIFGPGGILSRSGGILNLSGAEPRG